MDLYLSAFLISRIIYTPITDTECPELTTNTSDGYIFLFNTNPFMTAGTITSWIFAAQTSSARFSLPQMATFQFPQLQIWKSIQGGTYHLNFTTSINTLPPILLGALNMYNHTLDPPARYEENDIIGIYQPSNFNAALRVAFVNSDNTLHQALVEPITLENAETFTFNARRTSTVTTLLPLMTLATTVALIEPSQTYSSTSSVGQQLSITSKGLVDFTTPLTNPSLSVTPSRLDNGAVIGISVGVLGAILLLILIIILMLTLYIAKKKRNNKKFVIQNNLPLSPIGNQAACENSLGNPTYTGGMESVEFNIFSFNLYNQQAPMQGS